MTVGEKLIVPYKLSEVIPFPVVLLTFNVRQLYGITHNRIMLARPHHPKALLSNLDVNLVDLVDITIRGILTLAIA